MNPIGRMCGIDVVYGGRWDDVRGKAAFKATHDGVVCYYDEKDLLTSLVPAPAVALRLARPEDTDAAQAVFFHDDKGEIFSSVILSGGQIVPLSETLHEDDDAWLDAISKSLRDPNLDLVLVPDTVDIAQADKLRKFEIGGGIGAKGLPRLTSASGSRTLIGVALITLALAGIGGGTWAYLTDQFAPPPPEIRMVTENRVPEFGRVLESCVEDLSSPWPAPPEWDLVREGCVADWGTAQLSGLAPSEQSPHAYRLYEINPQIWDPYLSRLAFLRISERFPGRVIEGSSQFLLYLPYELETRLVDNAYLPNRSPDELVRSRFVGSVQIQGGAGMETFSASTPLEFPEVLSRLSGERLTTGHVYHDPRSGVTGFRFGPEQVRTRQVRAN